MPVAPEILRFSSPGELVAAAAQAWIHQLAQRPPGAWTTALSGGRIAGLFLDEVAGTARGKPDVFHEVHFFWSDERCVPPDDEASNFHLANRRLLQPLGIRPENVHRCRGELPPERAAELASEELSRVAGPRTEGIPVLDLVFLGLGEDAHIASLFPAEPESAVADLALFRAVTSPKPPPSRVTMGYPLIAAARQVWVLASGSGKAAALLDSLAPDGRTPLARLLKIRNTPGIKIFTDIG